MKKTGKFFTEIIKPERGTLFRGIALGTPILAVKELEGKKFEEETQIMHFVAYSFNFQRGYRDKFRVVYYYDKDQKVNFIEALVRYDPEEATKMTQETFTTLCREVDEYLQQALGEPTSETEEVADLGPVITKTWVYRKEAIPTEVTQMYYRDAKPGNPAEMKLILQPYTEA